jgi:hypothetical protein
MLDNQRHERFAWGVVQGKSATQAFIGAGYSKNSADANAVRLMGNKRIAARILELKQKAADGAVMSAQQVLERLTELATGARDPISLRALELLGRHHELFGDRRVGGVVNTDFDRLPTSQLLAILAEGEGGAITDDGSGTLSRR